MHQKWGKVRYTGVFTLRPLHQNWANYPGIKMGGGECPAPPQTPVGASRKYRSVEYWKSVGFSCVETALTDHGDMYTIALWECTGSFFYCVNWFIRTSWWLGLQFYGRLNKRSLIIHQGSRIYKLSFSHEPWMI